MSEGKPRRSPFRKVYDWVLHWAATPYAMRAAMLVALTSAWLLPVPPDILLIPLYLAKPEKTIRLGLLAAVLYTLGWIIGYWIGYYGHLWFGEQIVQGLGLGELLNKLHGYYDEYGAWAILAGSATPLSDKVFSIGSGILNYHFGKFVGMVALGGTIRIMAPAILIKLYGPPIVRFAEKYLEWVAFGMIASGLIVYLLIKTL